jgi:hypothetical protein
LQCPGAFSDGLGFVGLGGEVGSVTNVERLPERLKV